MRIEGCRRQPQQKAVVPGRVAEFESWLPIAIAVIVALRLYYVISGRCGELLTSSPTP
jgi:hypothetical protein